LREIATRSVEIICVATAPILAAQTISKIHAMRKSNCCHASGEGLITRNQFCVDACAQHPPGKTIRLGVASYLSIAL
jgi:hypothetical protein